MSNNKPLSCLYEINYINDFLLAHLSFHNVAKLGKTWCVHLIIIVALGAGNTYREN